MDLMESKFHQWRSISLDLNGGPNINLSPFRWVPGQVPWKISARWSVRAAALECKSLWISSLITLLHLVRKPKNCLKPADQDHQASWRRKIRKTWPPALDGTAVYLATAALQGPVAGMRQVRNSSITKDPTSWRTASWDLLGGVVVVEGTMSRIAVAGFDTGWIMMNIWIMMEFYGGWVVDQRWINVGPMRWLPFEMCSFMSIRPCAYIQILWGVAWSIQKPVGTHRE